MILVSTESARTLCRLYYRGASALSVAIVVWSAALDLLPAVIFFGLAVGVDGFRYTFDKRRAPLQLLDAGALKRQISHYWPVAPVSPRSVAIFLIVVFGGLYIVHSYGTPLIGAYSAALQERYAPTLLHGDMSSESAYNAYLLESFGLTLVLVLLLYFPMSATIRRPSTERLEDALRSTRFTDWSILFRALLITLLLLLNQLVLRYALPEPIPPLGALSFGAAIGGPLVFRSWLEAYAYLELKELTHN